MNKILSKEKIENHFSINLLNQEHQINKWKFVNLIFT